MDRWLYILFSHPWNLHVVCGYFSPVLSNAGTWKFWLFVLFCAEAHKWHWDPWKFGDTGFLWLLDQVCGWIFRDQDSEMIANFYWVKKISLSPHPCSGKDFFVCLFELLKFYHVYLLRLCFRKPFLDLNL